MHRGKDGQRDGMRREILRSWTIFQTSLPLAHCRTAHLVVRGQAKTESLYENRKTPHPLRRTRLRRNSHHQLRLLQQ
jgi:hypothetical protein